VLRHLDQPGLGILRDAFERPLLVGGNEGFVQKVFGNVEVADGTHKRGKQPAKILFVQGAEVLLEGRR
jgi:hypothetical protein